MNLKTKYWYWKKVFPDHMCDHIIQLGKEKKKEFAVVGHNENKELTEKDIEEQKKVIRDSKVAWFNEPWLFNMLAPYFLEANEKAEWHFIYDFIEPVQFTEYKPGQYYGFHQDSDFWVNKNPLRKLSCVVSLSDPKDYKGGNFRMNLKSGLHGSDSFLDVTHLNEKGNLIIFPSQLWHEVTKITEGTRYSLVAWAGGPPFSLMSYEINDNFLEQKELNYFKETILSNNFPWFLTGVQSDKDPLHKQFVHIFYREDNFNTDYKELLRPILNKLNPTAIHRIKANLLTKTHNIIEPPFHTDHTSKNVLSSILYINTNNGYTGFKDQKSLSIENRLITFPSCTPHYGSTCSDKHFRIVVNMVYIK